MNAGECKAAIVTTMDRGGVVVVSEEHVGGSCIVPSAADGLGMSVVRGMTGVGGVCAMCLARGGVGGEGMSGYVDRFWALPIP